jgi:hypothetical protein
MSQAVMKLFDADLFVTQGLPWIKALMQREFEPGCGLYVSHSSLAIPVEGFAFAPMIIGDNRHFVGSILHFGGLQIMMLFDPTNWKQDESAQQGWGYHRPSELVFQLGGRTRLIKLTWASGTPARHITFEMTPQSEIPTGSP